jgi:hypothetical protein
MRRLRKHELQQMVSLHQWLGSSYGFDNAFSAALAHCRATANSAGPFGEWSLERFTEALGTLVAHHYLAVERTEDQSKVYSVPRSKTKRSGAEHSLSDSIEAVKKTARDGPVTIREIRDKAKQRCTIIRTGIDIMSAMGIVKVTRDEEGATISWDHQQEELIHNVDETTQEYYRLIEENEALDAELETLKEQVRLSDPSARVSDESPEPLAQE